MPAKLTTIPFGIALAVLLVALSAWQIESGAVQQSAQGWQHLALENDLADPANNQELSRRINQLGREGWELVDVENITKDGTTSKTVYFFKRSQ